MNQDRLAVILHRLFPSYKIHTNVRKVGDVQSPFSGVFLELDYWIPALRLAFEYQDPHHYESTLYSYADPTRYTEGDILKKDVLNQRGDTLVCIPYWWDGKEESLVATIHLARKDVLPSTAYPDRPPIPSSPPPGFVSGSSKELAVLKIPDVGELTLASFASSSMLALDSWWMMEKYDGTRVCWNPRTKRLYTRSGFEAPLPPVLFVSLPPQFIDGEIWYGRDAGRERLATNGAKAKYQFLRMIGLDCPVLDTHEFEERYQVLLDSSPVDHCLLILVACSRCRGKTHLQNFTKNITTRSGEGSVVRKPKSLYVHGRTEILLKLKAYRDWEGLVVDIDQYDYHILKVDGTTVTAPKKDHKSGYLQLREPPEIGNVVTFVSISGTNESPSDSRFTRVITVRRDITWRDVVENAETKREHTSTLLWISEKAIAEQPTKQPQGYWTINENENSKKYFDEFANAKGFDPLLSENWYQFQGSDFKNATSIMGHYNSSLYKALSSVYPNIGLEMNRFTTVPHNYWTDIENRKRFFNDFANNHTTPFDPLISENWYPFTGFSFHHIKGGHTVMSYYNGSLTRALAELYPEIKFDEFKFKFKPREYWNNMENRRNFFTRYAQKNGFDPLIPTNWYSWRLNILDSEQNASIISSMYNGSYARALVSLFPEVRFDRSRFGKRKTKDVKN